MNRYPLLLWGILILAEKILRNIVPQNDIGRGCIGIFKKKNRAMVALRKNHKKKYFCIRIDNPKKRGGEKNPTETFFTKAFTGTSCILFGDDNFIFCSIGFRRNERRQFFTAKSLREFTGNHRWFHFQFTG